MGVHAISMFCDSLTKSLDHLHQSGPAYLLSGPLESGDDAVLDLIKVLHSLGAVNHQVGAVSVGTEAPDLPSNQYSKLN